MAVAANIILLFIVYTVTRFVFWAENHTYFSSSLADGNIPRMLFGGLFFDAPAICYTNALYIFLMLLPLHFKEKASYYNVCRWLFIIVNAICVIINLCDTVYFPYTLRRTTSDVFREFSNEGNLFSVFTQAALTHWYLILVAAAIIWGMWRLYVNPVPVARQKSLIKYYILTVLSLIAAAVMTVSGIRGGLINRWYNYWGAAILFYICCRIFRSGNLTVHRKIMAATCALVGTLFVATAPVGGFIHLDIRPTAISNATAYASRPVETAFVLNTPFSLIRSVSSRAFVDPGYFESVEEAEKLFSPLHKPSADIMPRSKNVVVLIIESFGREYIGALNHETLGDDYEGYTPFVDSLINHSATFRYSFCNGVKSIDGMPSVLASIPMFVKPFILTPAAMNRIKGLPALLREKGYDTAFFHGARTGSMGFDGFARSVGFDNYYGREDFNKDPRFDGDSDFDGFWAIWDEPFLQYYALKMSEMKPPFATAVFTASSHHPFKVPEKYADIYPEESLEIHKCIRYVDNALRAFFATARRQPWYENTVFVLTSDHTNMSGYPEYKSEMGRFFSPIIIFDPSGEIKPGMRDAIAQQIDIMPTLLAYLGYDRPYVGFGIDLLSTPAEDTWAVNYCNGIYQYSRDGVMLQFDGKKTTGIYALTDPKLEHDLLDVYPHRQQRERELKALIQSYMSRMINDRLSVSESEF